MRSFESDAEILNQPGGGCKNHGHRTTSRPKLARKMNSKEEPKDFCWAVAPRVAPHPSPRHPRVMCRMLAEANLMGNSVDPCSPPSCSPLASTSAFLCDREWVDESLPLLRTDFLAVESPVLSRLCPLLILVSAAGRG